VGEKTEPILTLVTRDRNRIALQSDVLGAAALGFGNVLCVSGDHQSLGRCPAGAQKQKEQRDHGNGQQGALQAAISWIRWGDVR
jgi:5,10-methylenetetrahydrofolate reductase